jgi:hypothetical protein
VVDATAEDFDTPQALNAKVVLQGCLAAAREKIDCDVAGALLTTASIAAAFSLSDISGTTQRRAQLTRSRGQPPSNSSMPRFGSTPLCRNSRRLSPAAGRTQRETVASRGTLGPVRMGREPDGVAEVARFRSSDAASSDPGEPCVVDGGFPVVSPERQGIACRPVDKAADDVEAIQRLKHALCKAIDYLDPERIASLFVSDRPLDTSLDVFAEGTGGRRVPRAGCRGGPDRAHTRSPMAMTRRARWTR